MARNIRVGLLDAGYYRTETLFESAPRDFAVLLIAPERGNPLVCEYRDLARLRASIPHGERITSWPGLPFVGEIGYADIRHVLRCRYRFYTRAERLLIDALLEYLAFKHGTRPNRTARPSEPTG
jgi:hypothetical protein